MPRIRSIHPEFWTSEPIGALSPVGRLLFLSMLNQADDNGYLPANLTSLRVTTFPYDPEVTLNDCDAQVALMIDRGLVRCLEVVKNTKSGRGDQKIITAWHIVGFHEHQSPKNPSYRYRTLDEVMGEKDGIPTPGMGEGSGIPTPGLTDTSPTEKEKEKEKEKNRGGSDDSKRSRRQTPSALVADEVYKRLNGFCNWNAVRDVARAPLKNGYTQEAIVEAMVRVAADKKPITRQIVKEYLDRPASKEPVSADAMFQNWMATDGGSA